MNYQEFLDACVDSVKKIVGKEAEVVIHRVTKNNGIVLDGLVIMEHSRHFAPTIYLNDYYAKYLAGCGIDDIAARIYRLYLSSCNNLTLPDDFFLDFEKLKDQIAFRLISYERNKELLRKIPHRRWKDLAIIYFVVCDNIDRERAVVTIYDNHLKLWDVTEKILYELAMKNTPRLYKAVLRPMNQVVSEMILKESNEDSIEELLEHVNKMNEEFPMYVLSNEMKTQGAACMLYDGLLAKFTNHIEADVYIIPSSIHEVILIPIDGEVTREGLADMVRSVNQTELSVEEILSDEVYVFTRKNGFE